MMKAAKLSMCCSWSLAAQRSLFPQLISADSLMQKCSGCCVAVLCQGAEDVRFRHEGAKERRDPVADDRLLDEKSEGAK